MILTLNFRHNATRRVEVESIAAADDYVAEAKRRGYFTFQDERGQSTRMPAKRLETWMVRDEKPKPWSSRRTRPRVESDALFEE